jgi:hypothetical protein
VEEDRSARDEITERDSRRSGFHPLPHPAAGWYKVLKVFILAGFLTGYYFFFGFVKTAVFLVVFMLLMLIVHLVYRIKTDKFRKSWLDFVVGETRDGVKAKSIGGFYYSSIIINALLSVMISQGLPV